MVSNSVIRTPDRSSTALRNTLNLKPRSGRPYISYILHTTTSLAIARDVFFFCSNCLKTENWEKSKELAHSKINLHTLSICCNRNKSRCQRRRGTQGLIETLGSMVIFDENQAVSDINKYEFLNTIYVKIVNLLVI